MVYFNDINDLKKMEKAMIEMKNSLASLKQANDEEQTQNDLSNSTNNVTK
jgi:hypothetical protein